MYTVIMQTRVKVAGEPFREGSKPGLGSRGCEKMRICPKICTGL